MTKVYAVVNQKGGVGKTTTAINIATVLAIMYKKVLLVDLDSQGNASSGIGINQHDRVITSYDLFTRRGQIRQSILHSEIPGLDIISSNVNLAGVELELANVEGHERLLVRELERIKEEYDYIIIDCPPSLNLLTLNALVASDKVIIPMLCDFYSLEGLSHLLKTIDIVKKRLNPQLEISGILLTMYDKRNRLTELVESDVRGCMKELVFDTRIPRNVRVSEAPSHGKSAVVYDHKCSGALAYISLAKEILMKEQELQSIS
jgi:chromosome partitioning protein